MCACESGRTAAVRLLLGAHADPNAADADGWTPLAFAARFGHLDIVKELLDAGARVDPRDCVRIYIVFFIKRNKNYFVLSFSDFYIQNCYCSCFCCT